MSAFGRTVSLAIFLFTFNVHALQDKTVHLEHADSLIGLVIDGEQARQLVGNVRFTQGTVEVR